MKTSLVLILLSSCAFDSDHAGPDAGELSEDVELWVLEPGATSPANGQVNVERNISNIVVSYSGSQLDCANPITGIAGFHLYSVDPILPASRQQHMYPDMPVGFGPTPQLVCEREQNRIRMTLPGYLLGGTAFRVETNARALDGSTLATTFSFRTKNPGLKVSMTKATNEIYECDTHYPGSTSYRCDIYVMGMVKTRVSSSSAWQINSKVPDSGDWSNWAENTTKTFSLPPVLYQDTAAIGDIVGIELHAYDRDSGDYSKAITAVGGLGKINSSFSPPSAVGEGQVQSSAKLAVGDDDFEGGGTYFLPKTTRWGTITGSHTFKLPGRPANSQIVIGFSVAEFPATWFAPPIVQ